MVVLQGTSKYPDRNLIVSSESFCRRTSFNDSFPFAFEEARSLCNVILWKMVNMFPYVTIEPSHWTFLSLAHSWKSGLSGIFTISGIFLRTSGTFFAGTFTFFLKRGTF